MVTDGPPHGPQIMSAALYHPHLTRGSAPLRTPLDVHGYRRNPVRVVLPNTVTYQAV